jgi:hypothetical protein
MEELDDWVWRVLEAASANSVSGGTPKPVDTLSYVTVGTGVDAIAP